MRSQRIQEIENYIFENRTVTLDQICERFDISKSTIRRDLKEMLGDGHFKKIYGGVTVEAHKGLVAFGERHVENLEAKRRIAARAAELVSPGDIIFIDSGTTTLHMINALAGKPDLTVLTNNFEAICRAIAVEGMNIISLSGTLNRKTLSFIGQSAAMELQNYHISKCYMATTGLTVASGVTNSSPLESEIKRAAVQRGHDVVLLADQSKFGVVSLITYCDLSRVGTLITDAPPPREMALYLHEQGTRLIIAE